MLYILTVRRINIWTQLSLPAGQQARPTLTDCGQHWSNAAFPAGRQLRESLTLNCVMLHCETVGLWAWVYNLPLFVSTRLWKDKDSVWKDEDFREV